MSLRFRSVITAAILTFAALAAISPAKATEYDRCLQFDGSNFVEASRNLIPVTGDYTIELMVYSSSKNQGKYAHYISQGAQPQPFYIGNDPNSKIRLGDQWIDSNYTMQHNRWVHLAVTHTSSNNGRLYVNGNLVAAAVGSYNTSKAGTVTRFGSQFFGSGGEFFTGCLDNIRIWKTVRDPKQIQDNWRLSTPVDKTDLVANYNFNNYYGYVDKIRSVQSEDGNNANTLIFRNSPVSVPESASFVSTNINGTCFNNPSNRYSRSGIPNIDQVVARNKYTTLLQMNLSQVPLDSCVGVDLFIKGSNVPISSTIALNSAGRDLLYLDTANFACHWDPNSRLVARAWGNNNGNSTIYSDPVDIPACAGNIPSSNSTAMTENQTLSLISDSTPQNYEQTINRIRASDLQLPNSQINGQNQKILEFSGCHAKVSVALIQRAANGVWLDAQPAEGWDTKSYCDAAHPFQPFVNINYPDGTILRWKISDGYNWEVFSLPFVFKSSNATGNPTTTASPTPSQSTSSNPQEPVTQPNLFAVPFAFSPTIKGNNVIINVSFNKVVEQGSKLFLISDSLGYGSSKPLIGTVKGNKGSLVVPKTKFAKLKTDPTVKMQTKSASGDSPALQGKIPLNSLKLGTAKTTPAKVSKPVTAPKQITEAPDTVICYKGSLIRTFLSKTCPPGWTTKG